MRRLPVAAVGVAACVAWFVITLPEPQVEEPRVEPSGEVRYPVYSEEEYLEKFAADPDRYRIADVRWQAVLPAGKQNRFANSLGEFDHPDELERYLVEHHEELEDKEILFICYGGARAQMRQQQMTRALEERGLSLDLVGFRPNRMLGDKPDWLASRVRYVPETLTDRWHAQGVVELVALDVPDAPDDAFWGETRARLSGRDRPIVVRTDADPAAIELGIYPLESRRRYEIRDWRTPPGWFAAGVYGFATSNGGSFELVLVVVLGAMLWATASIRLKEAQAPARSPARAGLSLARLATVLAAFTFVFYGSFCFLEYYWVFDRTKYSTHEIFFTVLLFILVAYRSGAARDELKRRLDRRAAVPPREVVAGWRHRLRQAARWAGWLALGATAVLVATVLLRNMHLFKVLRSWALPVAPVVLAVWLLLFDRERGRALVGWVRASFAVLRPVFAFPLIWFVSMRMTHEVFEPHHLLTPPAYVAFCVALLHLPLSDALARRRLNRPRTVVVRPAVADTRHVPDVSPAPAFERG